MSCQHWTAGNKNRRNIQSCRCHQKTGHIFITVRDTYQTIELMCHRHTLGAVADQVSGYEGIFHADMSHRDTIADCDCREYNRGTSSHRNAELDRFCNFIQVHMSGHDFVIGVYNTDQRSVLFLLCHAQSIHQTSVGCLLDAFCYIITSHLFVPHILLSKIKSALQADRPSCCIQPVYTPRT